MIVLIINKYNCYADFISYKSLYAGFLFFYTCKFNTQNV